MREPFQTIAEVLHLPGRMAMTVRIGIRGDRTDPLVESDLVVSGVGDKEIRREIAAARDQVLLHLGGTQAPYAMGALPLADLAWPKSGHGAFIRQQSVYLGDERAGFELPLRFAFPGPDAPQRLLATLLAAGPGTDLFVSATPTTLRLEERDRLAAALSEARGIAEDVVEVHRDVATALDASLSYRTDLYVLQLLLISEKPLTEVLARAVGSAVTAPFDAERQVGMRIVSRPNRFVGGGFEIEPCRDPRVVLTWLRYGLPWLGFGSSREIVDIVTSTELAFCFSWITTANGTVPGIASERSAAPRVEARGDSVCLGSDAFGAPVRVAGHDRHLHAAVIGATGSGKTTLLADIAVQDAEAGRGLVVIDPHGDLCDRVLAHLPPGRRDHVHILDGRNGEMDQLNLLRTYAPDSDRQQQVTTAVIDGMIADLNKDYAGPVFWRAMSRLLRLAGVSAGTVLDAERYLQDLDLLVSDAHASGIVDLVDFALEVRHWSSSYRAELSHWASSKLEWLRSPGLRGTFASPDSTFDLPTALEEGHIVLVYPGTDYTGASVAMSVCLAVILSCLVARTETSPSISFFLDEMQLYSGVVLGRMLNETRKRAVSLHLATQNLMNVHGQLEALLGNVGTLVVGRCQGVTAGFAAAQLGSSPEQMGRLPNFRALARIPVNGAPCDPFELTITPPNGPRADGFPAWVSRKSLLRGDGGS